jgi:glycosyltransferase involved in cell wall biosynthesis
MQKVSLLITTYNVKDHLTVTLESIEAQDYGSIELVIVDGGSTDGTAAVIRGFAAKYPDGKGQPDGDAAISVRWVSEPDRRCHE